jgi:GTPase Era involved in 16S rRNA processing
MYRHEYICKNMSLLYKITEVLSAWIHSMYSIILCAECSSTHTLAHINQFTSNHELQGPWHYSPDQISDLPLRNIAAEITRESILLRAHEEVPYVAFVETEKYEERKDGSVRIEQVVSPLVCQYLSVCLLVCLSTWLSVYLSVRRYLSAFLSTCLPI